MAESVDGKPSYIFNRNFKSSIRLNHNHWLMKSISGYLLHPDIPEIDAGARIADVGTGTAIWLLETAGTLPDSVQLDGFDISPDQYPAKVWWPKNVNLMVHDAFQPFPQEYQGTYDVVHARFFLCLVNDDNAERLLRNLVSLLKPGGYLQWFEPNANEVRVRQDNPDASTEHVERLAESFRKPTPTSSYNWLINMPDLFREHGLILEARDELDTQKHLMLPWEQSSLAGFDDLVSNTQIVATSKADELRHLMNGLAVEFGQGVALETKWLCFVGRKPT